MADPHTGDIRGYLTSAYGDEDLATLCSDYFRDVYENFTAGMTKAQKIQLLLDRCQRRETLPELLAALERDRPEQYRKRFGELIDDQRAFLTAELLRLLKEIGESNAEDLFLERVWTGQDLLGVVIGAYGYDFRHDEPNDEYEARKIASFLQTAQDFGEFGDTLEAGDRVGEGFRLTQIIKEIELMGFRVFGARYERYQSKKATQRKAESWPVAALRLVRVPTEDDRSEASR
jgi:hypothetical protein